MAESHVYPKTMGELRIMLVHCDDHISLVPEGEERGPYKRLVVSKVFNEEGELVRVLFNYDADGAEGE